MRNEEFGYNPSIAHLEELEAIREILENTQNIMVGIGFVNCLILLIILFKI
jgi:hypothetical protein|tara:strand:- start:220 stop:372 length:153 start_codon:yes stop_codon:yes gene_type:complete